MEYQKPEITRVSTAVAAIQSQGKQISTDPDSSLTKVTVASYESDE